jgi:hypothetical protein
MDPDHRGNLHRRSAAAPRRGFPGPAGRALGAFLLAIAGGCLAVAAEPAAPIDFDRDIRPILSDNCFRCHGPDEAERKRAKTDLRLDTRDGLFADLDGVRPVVPKDPARSEIMLRLTSSDEDERMPPVETGKHLLPEQIALVRRWIEQGAPWNEHWAFVPPRRPALPPTRQQDWPRNDLDRFVLARLEAEGMRPAREAERTTLIRRLSLDLTGLPPTPAEVDAFLADRSPQAYDLLVDRLLASPRYGEHLALGWLDGARYADSHGYQADYERFMWRWRDWVIEAFNRNLPYDQFTIEQLAGDLLPEPTLEQRIATGFNRNHRINTEGGIIAEEWRVESVIDRVETTGSVWLGLTLGCARCHDHKYDPVSQRDFYRFFAFFNNVNESGTGKEKAGNQEPVIKAPRPEEARRLRDLGEAVAIARRRVAGLESSFTASLPAREGQLLASDVAEVGEGLVAHFALAGDLADSRGGWPAATWQGGKPEFKDGIAGKAAVFDGKDLIVAGAASDGPVVERESRFSVGAWIKRRDDQAMTVLARLEEGKAERGWELQVHEGRLIMRLIGPEHAIAVTSRERLRLEEWTHVFATYDGSGTAAGMRLFIDGVAVEGGNGGGELRGPIAAKQPLRIGGRQKDGRWKGQLADVRFYQRALAPGEVRRIADLPLRAIATLAPDERSATQARQLATYLRAQAGGPLGEADRILIEAERQLREYEEQVPTVMVMEELAKPRDAFVLLRGEYDKRGEKVEAGTPAAFPPLKADWPRNRLGLARWIVDPANPLTARVTANRVWERLFGVGLVKSSENFGQQADPPSDRDLLDWLASELVRRKWDLKAFHKLIVTSATYRQSSVADAERTRRDPENRLLSRGPRFRLQAEVIRDQAMFVAGLLTERQGGPSVRPYQPPGIWDELSNYGNLHNYQVSPGADLHRRSLYTIWKRTTPPPNVSLLDMPSREYCVVRRSRTNTPLQALVLMNDVTFVEAARVLAQRMLTEGGSDDAARIAFGFRLATSRPPTTAEATVFAAAYQRRLARFRADPEAAKQLIAQGQAPLPPKLDPAELAAFTMTASTMLNLDETVTKE